MEVKVTIAVGMLIVFCTLKVGQITIQHKKSSFMMAFFSALFGSFLQIHLVSHNLEMHVDACN